MTDVSSVFMNCIEWRSQLSIGGLKILINRSSEVKLLGNVNDFVTFLLYSQGMSNLVLVKRDD